LLSSELNCYPPKFQNEYDEISTQMQSIELQYKYTNNNVNCETHPPFIISTNFKYVNSGGYIGYAKSILQMLKWKSIEKITEICLDGGDQSYFNYYYLKNAIPSMISFLNGDKLHIQIDYKQTIFQSMYRINFTDFYFINGRLYNSILHSKPCFAHFNGYKIYDDKIMSLDTETAENVYEVFIKNIISSFIQWDTKHPLNYRVLYYLFYNGKYQFNLPQIK
jgi:hypothetical protein